MIRSVLAQDFELLLFRPHLDGQLEFHRVSRVVNATRGAGDSADMINPL
jgi:hypothetical protein